MVFVNHFGHAFNYHINICSQVAVWWTFRAFVFDICFWLRSFCCFVALVQVYLTQYLYGIIIYWEHFIYSKSIRHYLEKSHENILYIWNILKWNYYESWNCAKIFYYDSIFMKIVHLIRFSKTFFIRFIYLSDMS